MTRGAQQSAAPGLYLHLPFCRSICPYCDFAVTLGDAGKRRSFSDSLVSEIELVGSAAPWPEFDTIYFGGGTPSALDPQQLATLLESISGHLQVSREVEIFLEVNPEDVSASALAAWRELGVRFLSLGVQSFDDASLRFLGRGHDGAASRRAVDRALAAGFDTVSLDLIFGLPNDTVDRWCADLDAAIAREVDHVSCYQLTIHRATAFGARRARGELVELGEGLQADLFAITHERLEAAGLEGYEVSNFARRPENRSAHNQKYWGRAPYLGLGPSAHSFDGRRRWWNQSGLGAWSRALARGERPLAESETLTRPQLVLERWMLGLRTRRGVDLTALEERYGLALLEPNRERLRRSELAGLLVVDGGRVRPTRAGMAVADALARELVVGGPSVGDGPVDGPIDSPADAPADSPVDSPVDASADGDPRPGDTKGPHA